MVATFLLLNPGQGVVTAVGSWVCVSAQGAGGPLSAERCPDSSWRTEPRRGERGPSGDHRMSSLF